MLALHYRFCLRTADNLPPPTQMTKSTDPDLILRIDMLSLITPLQLLCRRLRIATPYNNCAIILYIVYTTAYINVFVVSFSLPLDSKTCVAINNIQKYILLRVSCRSELGNLSALLVACVPRRMRTTVRTAWLYYA